MQKRSRGQHDEQGQEQTGRRLPPLRIQNETEGEIAGPADPYGERDAHHPEEQKCPGQHDSETM